MLVNPYLTFNGACEEAFKFYEKALGAKIAMMMNHRGTPMEEHVPAQWRDKIMHARLLLGEQVIMGSDAPPDHYQKPAGFSISINVDDPEEADRLFAALAEGGTARMPIQETFWAKRFGMLVDKFDVPWMINCEKPAAH